ncbi:MAG TPA: 2-dehydropantoate 2-reductase N-terminal domain-containing protein [Candidatus Dormibacteraeota bacterium]|nr:2-dehydropantoate 2-reductase N-terminal domain-containing protein [Candidatus Dormibacteraeota bacterium]
MIGAGAVGGLVSARLHESGADVTVVARGPQYRTIRASGLLVVDPERARRIKLRVISSLAEAPLHPDDVLLIAVKSQDIPSVLLELVAARPSSHLNLVVLGNGMEGDRTALRLFPRVQSTCLMCPVSHLSPGVVKVRCSPVPGVVDIGRYPAGIDSVTTAVSSALKKAGFESQTRSDIVRWKWGKLLINLGNAVEAICGPEARDGWLVKEAVSEARACFAATHIEFVEPRRLRARERAYLADIGELRERSSGGSSWQSLQRSTGSIETDFLNGEVVLLGRMQGVPTPVNELLQRVARQMAQRRARPGSVPETALRSALHHPALVDDL